MRQKHAAAKKPDSYEACLPVNCLIDQSQRVTKLLCKNECCDALPQFSRICKQFLEGFVLFWIWSIDGNPQHRGVMFLARAASPPTPMACTRRPMARWLKLWSSERASRKKQEAHQTYVGPQSRHLLVKPLPGRTILRIWSESAVMPAHSRLQFEVTEPGRQPGLPGRSRRPCSRRVRRPGES
jgi:hypothetical protein